MKEKNEGLGEKAYTSDEEKIATIKRFYDGLGYERDGFLGYIQIKLGWSNNIFYNKIRGATKVTPYEWEAMQKVMEEHPWRQVD